MTGLEDILNDDPKPEPTDAPEAKESEAPAPQEAESPPEPEAKDDTGGKAAEKPQEDAPPASKEPEHVPMAALIEERRKRQEAERRMQEWERQQREQREKQRPDWHNEPDKAASTLEKQFETRLLNERFNMSETVARQAYGSETIDQDVEAFEALVQERPYLREELRNAAHPYDFVHQTVTKEKALKEIGDPQSYKEKLREELLNDPEFLKAATAKAGATVPAKPAKAKAPPSLAGEASAKGASGPPTHRSLDDILNP